MEIATIGNVDSVLDIEVVQRFGIIDEEDIDIIIEPLPNIILPYRDTLPIYRKSQLSIPFFFTVPRELKGIHKETILCITGTSESVMLKVIFLSMAILFALKGIVSLCVPLSSLGTVKKNGMLNWLFLYIGNVSR